MLERIGKDGGGGKSTKSDMSGLPLFGGGGGVEQWMTDDDFMMDLSDTLFTSLNQMPFAFPNPKEICKLLG